MRHPRLFRLLLILPLVAGLAVLGCSDADEVDSGGVSLVIADFDGLPFRVSVNASGGVVQVDEIELESIIQNPDLGTGNLQTIQLRTYEVRYTRADTGTAVPTPLVQGLLGTVSPGGSTTLENLPVMLAEQMLNPPISDLLFVNGGSDSETGSEVIKLNLIIRFFGETLGGRDVVSNSQSFAVEFVP